MTSLWVLLGYNLPGRPMCKCAKKMTQVLYAVGVVESIVYVEKGGTRHLYYLNTQQKSTTIKWYYTTIPFVLMALAAVKSSIALLSLILMGPNKVWRKWFLYLNLVFLGLLSFLICIFIFLTCNQSQALRDDVPGARWWPSKLSADLMIFNSCESFVRLHIDEWTRCKAQATIPLSIPLLLYSRSALYGTCR